MDVQVEFWGELRSWVHGDVHLYDTLMPLFDGVDDPLKQEAAQYIAQHVNQQDESIFGADAMISFERVAKHYKYQYRARYMHRIKQLRAHPQVSAATCKPGRPVKDKVIERVRRDWSIELPPAMLAFYTQMDGVQLEWSSTLEDPYAEEASSAINPLARVFGGYSGMRKRKPWTYESFEGSLWFDWMDDDDEEEFAWIKTAKHLESIEGVSMELIQFFEPEGQDSVAVLDGNDVLLLNMDFEATIEHHLSFLGYSYWYYMFVAAPEPWMVNSINPLSVATLFPDRRPLLEERAKALGLESLEHWSALNEQE